MAIALVNETAAYRAVRELEKRAFTVIRLPRCENMPSPLAYHPDMLIFHRGDTMITSADYYDKNEHVFSQIREKSKIGALLFSSDTQGSTYPQDAIFNVLKTEDTLFLKKDSVSSLITEYANKNNLRTVNVKQGYPACTVLYLGDKKAITADHGMKRALEGEGIKVTLIENGGISLSPYEYGFIGGACGVYGGCAYFFGDVNIHPSAEKIKCACAEAHLDVVCLTDGMLTDLGGIVFID